MPNLTITIPTGLVPEAVTIAERFLTAKGISFAGMTSTQKGQRYLAEILKDELVKLRAGIAESDGLTSLGTARTTMETNVRTAITSAQSDGSGITG
jgi:hypothetical protein